MFIEFNKTKTRREREKEEDVALDMVEATRAASRSSDQLFSRGKTK